MPKLSSHITSGVTCATGQTVRHTLLCAPQSVINKTAFSKGLSLVELMVSATLLIITVGLSTSIFADMIDRHRINQQTDELLGSLRFARTQAINQNLDVYICRATSANECSDSRTRWADWSDGWLIFADMNNNREFDASDMLVRQYYDPGRPFLLTINQPGRLRFRHNGSSRNLGFYFCSKRPSASSQNSKITLLYTGRTRVEKLSYGQLPDRCKIQAGDA